jgi:hypothetical protein
MPFFCNSCNTNINNNIIVKVGINFYKSPLCVRCNESRGLKIHNKEEQVQETRLTEPIKAVETIEPKRRKRRTRIFKRSN